MFQFFKIHNFPVKSALIALLILVIGFLAILTSLFRATSKDFIQKNFKAVITTYSIDFYNPDLGEPSFRLSPLDDYYYFQSSKAHLVDSAFTQDKSITTELRMTLNRLFRHNQLIWAIIGNSYKDKVRVRYEITKRKDNWIEIKRFIKIPNNEINAVGQAITFCRSCFIKDDKDRTFFQSEKLPEDITKLFLLSQNGKVLLEIAVEPKQEIYLGSQWNLLELKTNASPNQPVSQLIKI